MHVVCKQIDSSGADDGLLSRLLYGYMLQRTRTRIGDKHVSTAQRKWSPGPELQYALQSQTRST
jgi:hypothetical protein